MRIAEIAPVWMTVPPANYGGIELVVALLADGLTERGHDVTLFASGGSKTKANLVSPLPAPPEMEEMGMNIADEVFHAVTAYLQAGNFDVIHDHSGFGPALGAMLGGNPPVVNTLHGPWTDVTRRFYSALGDRVYPVAISESQASQNPDVRYAGVVYNGLDLDAYPFQPEKDDYLLFLGRSNREKGPEVAVEVAKRAGMPLKMVTKRAEPMEHEHWEEAVEPRLTGEEELIFNAPHDPKVELLQRARATLCTMQWQEPFGLVMVESMACGTPVIAPPMGAAPEVVEDGVTGFLRSDIDDMVEAIERLDEIDPEACRTRVEERFSAGAMVEGYEKVFEEVVAGD